MDFTLPMIKEITGNFAEEQKIGQGGYAIVYKGVHNGNEIAVKKLFHLQGLDDKVFENESLNLMKIKHQNVVKLVGYCFETKNTTVEHKGKLVFAELTERVLCFEYMKRGSLANYISDESGGFDWPTRYKIIKGTCEGLNYLHNIGEGNHIYHLDLKPGNILLDENMAPKIADFGLSRLFESSRTQITKNVKGTSGYMPPEFIDEKKITNKFDVFSLGVIIIEIMAGANGNKKRSEMSPQDFVESVNENWRKRLQAESRYTSLAADMLAVKLCTEISLRCVEKDREKRPTIKGIVDALIKLDADIEKMTMDQHKLPAGQTISDSKHLELDPVRELRFPFEVNREISCCLQLTNQTDHFIVFNIKANQQKYSARPNKGTMTPCSSCYIIVTMNAQEKAPPNMQCHDMFLVQSTRVNECLQPDNITEDLFKKEMGKVVDKLPIVYVPMPPAWRLATSSTVA